ncbi:MAG TPA: hypothetical protein PLR07_10520, partial [Promineifilum sp.]|nr:hypothetical protein [Promineifilum sp.]
MTNPIDIAISLCYSVARIDHEHQIAFHAVAELITWRFSRRFTSACPSCVTIDPKIHPAKAAGAPCGL